MSLSQLNRLEPAQQREIYARIVPPRLWPYLAQVDPAYAGGWENPGAFRVITDAQQSEAHLRCPAQRHHHDFAFSLDLADSGGGQLELAFIVVNDVTQPRFNIDVDAQGNLTLLGTASRHLAAEQAAFAAGLGPCQVRKGLGLFAELLPRLESFAREQGYVGITLEPLTYHNAVMYENHGFAYTIGRKRMVQLNREFQPGGALYRLLDARNMFRTPDLAASARGRSWTIHDGILGDFDEQTHLQLHMVKVVGQHAQQRTFSPWSV